MINGKLKMEKTNAPGAKAPGAAAVDRGIQNSMVPE
jgi:hypothetical protein